MVGVAYKIEFSIFGSEEHIVRIDIVHIGLFYCTNYTHFSCREYLDKVVGFITKVVFEVYSSLVLSLHVSFEALNLSIVISQYGHCVHSIFVDNSFLAFV